MNQQFKTILLTIVTLSIFVIALVELSGVSSTALYNKYNIKVGNPSGHSHDTQQQVEDSKVKAATMPQTEITFDNTKYSFGNIKEGDVVKHDYNFTNTGDNPLLITEASASCGCTVPNYPKEPVAPGGTGIITVEFNSKNKKGHQNKSVLIHFNGAASPTSIGFDAEVK